MVRPKLKKSMCPNAYAREEVDDLTPRAGEAGMWWDVIDASNVEDNGWWPPLVDEGWHAIVKPFT